MISITVHKHNSNNLIIVAFIFLVIFFIETPPSFQIFQDAEAAIPLGAGDIEDLIPFGASFQVDNFVGSARENYPILVPPARGGLSPKLSLNYNSSGGNGWLGLGWDLSIGFIQRKGVRKGVPKYNDTDVFEINLDGTLNELVHFQDGTGYRDYRLRIEGAYLKIRYYTSTKHWEVWDKSGVKMKFGSSVDSRIGTVLVPDAITNTYRWCLDWVEDPKRNYMEILYSKDIEEVQPGVYRFVQIYPQEIKYNGQTGTPGLDHNHKIIFTLEDRGDHIYNYRAGFKMLTRKRLSRIEIKTIKMNETPPAEVLVRKYHIEYEPSSAKSLLEFITLYGNDGLSLPPARYHYQTHNHGFQQTGTAWPNGADGFQIRHSDSGSVISDVIDMNGDGLLDRIQCGDPTCSSYVIRLNNYGNGFNAQHSTWSNPSPSGMRHIRKKDSIGVLADFIDLNGDGLPDRVVRDSQNNNRWIVYRNNGINGFLEGENWENVNVLNLPNGNYIRNYDSGGTWSDVIDMNGDGLPDRVVTRRVPPYNYEIYRNNGHGFESQSVTWENRGTSSYLRSMSSTWECPIFYKECRGGTSIQSDFIDMNGDGLPDQVVVGYSNYWTVYFNTGSNFDNNGVNWSVGGYGGTIRSYYSEVPDRIHDPGDGVFSTLADMIDMNGDGLLDYVAGCVVYFNNGKGFDTQGVTWSNVCPAQGGGWADYIGWMSSAVIDLNGDGLPDQVNGWTVYFNSNNNLKPDLLSKVENGIGGTIDIEYKPSTVYDNTDKYEIPRLPFVVQTVHKYTQSDGINGAYTTKYWYDGGYYDPIEAEFWGFEKVTTFQMLNDESYESMTETWYHQDYFKKGKSDLQIITSRDQHTKRVDNVWNSDAYPTGHGGKFPALVETTTTVTDFGVPPYSSLTAYHYDSYFNMDEEHKYGSTNEEQVHNYSTYTGTTSPNCTNNWILSKPTEITTKDYEGKIFSRKWMDYDCTTGDLTKEEACNSSIPNNDCVYRNAAPKSITEYRYDDPNDYGNLSAIIDPRGYKTTFSYDASTKTHVYETKKCVILGDPDLSCSANHLHVTTTEYDPGTGNLRKLVPPHLQNTAYWHQTRYDEFGRKILERLKDNPENPNLSLDNPIVDRGATSYTYVNFGNPNAQYVNKIEHIVAEGYPNLEHHTNTQFDGMGRTFAVWNSGPDGKAIVRETVYDPSIPRIWKKSNPYLWLNAPLETIYYSIFTYDGFSRGTQVEIPDTPSNTFINTAYQGLKKVGLMTNYCEG